MENKVKIDKVKAKEFANKIYIVISKILFVIMLIMTFYVSQKLAVIIDLVSVQTLSQFINVILAIIVVLIYKKK